MKNKQVFLVFSEEMWNNVLFEIQANKMIGSFRYWIILKVLELNI